MTYDQAIQLYLTQNPGAKLETPEEQDAFNRWSGQLSGGSFEAHDPNAAIFDKYPDLAQQFVAAKQTNPNLSAADFAIDWANKNPNDPRLDDAGFLGSVGIEIETGDDVPAEQAFGRYALDQAGGLIAGDAKRKDEAAAILASYKPGFDASRQLIADLSQGTDAQRYFSENPDVADAYAAAKAANPSLDANQFVREHWETWGRKEGRNSPIRNSAVLNSELQASDDAAGKQITALNTQLGSLKENLGTELAAKTTNLQASLTALTSGLNTFTAAERASLGQQVASQFAALETEVASKRAAISQQLSTMGNAVSAYDVSMRTALQKELDQLNAAQEPLNAARISGAETIAASVNLGAQAQQDRVMADAAQAGYIGSSTGTDMAIARAAIGGRQGAAEAMGSAKIANATDTAGIARYGANTEFGIASNTAGATRDLGYFGAGENRALSDFSATGRRSISDFGSAGVRGIDNVANTGALNISNFGATEGRTIADYGAGATRANADFGAGEKRNIADTAAARGLSFFSQDLQRRLSALSLPAAAVSAEFQVRGMADAYGQSGFNTAMKNLNQFRTNAPAAPAATPFTGNTGYDSGIADLGAGMVSLAGGVAKANNYWSAPKQSVIRWDKGNNPAPGSDASNPFDP